MRGKHDNGILYFCANATIHSQKSCTLCLFHSLTELCRGADKRVSPNTNSASPLSIFIIALKSYKSGFIELLIHINIFLTTEQIQLKQTFSYCTESTKLQDAVEQHSCSKYGTLLQFSCPPPLSSNEPPPPHPPPIQNKTETNKQSKLVNRFCTIFCKL